MGFPLEYKSNNFLFKHGIAGNDLVDEDGFVLSSHVAGASALDGTGRCAGIKESWRSVQGLGMAWSKCITKSRCQISGSAICRKKSVMQRLRGEIYSRMLGLYRAGIILITA
jgi:hypothetical protein